MRKRTQVLRAIDHILSPEQYAKRRHKTPYLYTLGTGDDALTFIGTKHSVNPTEEQYQLIPEYLTSKRPDVVMIEGMQGLTKHTEVERLLKTLTPEEAIRRGGEAVYTITEAMRLGIPWQCPEPLDRALMRHLVLQFYTPEELVAWYTLRLLNQYHTRSESIPFAGYVAPFLGYLKHATAWPHVTYTYEAAFKTATQVLGHEPNVHNAERIAEYTDPIPWPARWEQQTRFNDITRAALQYRDHHITKRVAEVALSGKRVLVVYGAGHAVMQEPAYRYLFT